MTDKLWAIVNFTGIAIGDTQTLPHGIQVSGRPIIPDRVDLQIPSRFQFVSGNATTVTIRNVSDPTGDCSAWVFAIHPVARSFGLSPDDGTFAQGMVPRPFSQDAAGVSPTPPFPPTPIVVTIFARLTGSDTTGTGTLLNPYRTAKRAAQDVVNPIPAGVRFVVNDTGIGLEEFPVGYQLQVMGGTVQLATFGDAATSPFLASGAFTLFAEPQPFSGIPLADTTVPQADIVSITANADTGLALVTTATPRASWAADALAGTLLTGDGGDASTTCRIYGSDATHLRLCNTTGAVPAQTLSIVEVSARFHSAGPGADGAGFEVVGNTSVVIQGHEFTCDGGGQGLLIGGAIQPFIEGCDIAGLSGYGNTQQLGLFSSRVSGLVDMEGATSLTPRRSLFQGATFQFYGGNMQIFRQCVLNANANSVGPSTFSNTEGGLIANGWEFLNVLFTGSLAATGAVFCRGGGSWSFEAVRFDGGAGDAIHATGYTTVVVTQVTGATNVGGGIHTEDSAQCRVTDDATLVTGTAGDILCGTLPARTWNDFRNNVPTKNQYDLQTPFVTNVASGLDTPGGDDVTGAGSGGCSGSRVFQRP